MKRNPITRCVTLTLVVLPFLLAGASNAFSQRNLDQELPMKQLLSLPGKVVSEARSARPTAELRLTGYRIEELQLPRNITVDLQGRSTVVDKAWRVTVNGGPFPVRAMPAVIWIDDQIVGYGIENETLSQITAITFDGSLIRAGGIVSLSYGEDKESRVRISQGLQMKREGENQ